MEAGLHPWRIPDKEERGKYLQHTPGVPGVPANFSPGDVRGVPKGVLFGCRICQSVSASRRVYDPKSQTLLQTSRRNSSGGL